MIGVGYRPRTGAIFFTRNGKRLEEVVHGLKSQNFFPAIGANGPAVVHVNLGQSGFVFIEANVKKWGLAPVTGSLAPPPPYGSEQGSILLESGTKDGATPGQGRPHGLSVSSSPYNVHVGSNLNAHHGRSRSGNFRVLSSHEPWPHQKPDGHLPRPVWCPTTRVARQVAVRCCRNSITRSITTKNPLHLHLEDATKPAARLRQPNKFQRGSTV